MNRMTELEESRKLIQIDLDSPELCEEFSGYCGLMTQEEVIACHRATNCGLCPYVGD